jgi:hypothetical protein
MPVPWRPEHRAGCTAANRSAGLSGLRGAGDLLQETEGVGFHTALEMLAARHAVAPERAQEGPGPARKAQRPADPDVVGHRRGVRQPARSSTEVRAMGNDAMRALIEDAQWGVGRWTIFIAIGREFESPVWAAPQELCPGEPEPAVFLAPGRSKLVLVVQSSTAREAMLRVRRLWAELAARVNGLPRPPAVVAWWPPRL